MYRMNFELYLKLLFLKNELTDKPVSYFIILPKIDNVLLNFKLKYSL